jgi:hypothetical protein
VRPFGPFWLAGPWGGASFDTAIAPPLMCLAWHRFPRSDLPSLCVCRFNRLAWGYVEPQTRPRGVIAAGMENGELALWDPEKIIAGEG